MDWAWDPSLYEGSAPHYAVGRMAYPAALADALRDALGLDGSGRLLDVGCGPGSLTLLLAPLVASAVGVDADAGMIAEARRSGAAGIEWRQLRAEELPADLGTFRLVTFAQSFHWMDQPQVARAVRPMIEPGGAWVHVFATTHRGAEGDDALPHPRPPWDAIDALVAGYLGPVRRAGQGALPTGTRGGEEDVMRDVGYRGPRAARGGARRRGGALDGAGRVRGVLAVQLGAAPVRSPAAGVRRRPAPAPAIGVPGRHVRRAGARRRRRDLASVTGLSRR